MDKQFFDLVTMASHGPSAMVIAALALYLIMWGILKVPWVSNTLLTTPWRKRAAVVFLAVAPAVVDALVMGKSWKEVASVALMMALGATGVHQLVSTAKDPGEPVVPG